MKRLLLIMAAAAVLAPLCHPATLISVDTSTTLLDASNFTTGVTYYATWQLAGSGTVSNTASLSAFDLGGGTGVNRQGGDPTDDAFVLGPNALSTAGVWQLAATLDLIVDTSDSYSLYTQQFVAGDSFAFSLDLTANLLAGNAPDAFTFQLYDANLETLLYEVSLDLLGEREVPEPSALSLGFLGIGLLGALRIASKHARK